MVTSRSVPDEVPDLRINEASFEKVNDFKYLGSRITIDNSYMSEINKRILQGNRCFYSLIKTMKSRSLSRKTKIRIYRTVIRPVVMYGAETWVLTKESERRLDTWERKLLRKIYGPVQENGEWRVRHNSELYELYKDPPLTIEIRSQNKMGRTCRKNGRLPSSKTSPHKATSRKEANRTSEKKMALLNIRRWRHVALDRIRWREIVEKAKDLQDL